MQWYASTQPEEENVVAGAASAMLMMYCTAMGLGVSVIVGMICGSAVAVWVSNQLAHQK
jgi:hypothetical protein